MNGALLAQAFQATTKKYVNFTRKSHNNTSFCFIDLKGWMALKMELPRYSEKVPPVLGISCANY